MATLTPKDRIIYALDVPDLAEARVHVARLAGHVGVFKVGLELFVKEGPEVVRVVTGEGGRVFLDLKLHDIPATMRAALASVAALGPRFVTVHGEGLHGLDDAGAAAPDVCVLAVTALTSLDGASLKAAGYRDALCDPRELVLARARLAKAKGCGGVVCSGHEAAAVRRELGDGFVIVTPGIRPAWAGADDQARITTPAQAVADGADYLVIGRPIRMAADPAWAADRIAEEIGALTG